MVITNSGRVGIGTEGPSYALDVHEDGGGASMSARVFNKGTTASDHATLRIQIAGTTADSNIYFGDGSDSDAGAIRYDHSNNRMTFRTAAADEVYIHSNGALTVDNTDSTFRIAAGSTPGYTGGSGQEGWGYDGTRIEHQTDTTSQMLLNDSSSAAGTHNYIVFYYRGSAIGDIDTADNTTIRYNTFTGAHWSQMHGSSDLLRGTVMSTIDELLEWTSFEFINAEGQTEKTTMAGTDYVVGQTYTIAIDEDGATAEATATGYETASRLMRVKVSDVEGDRAVYGVFSGSYVDGDISVEALGVSKIRIGSGVTVQRGDLLMSAGDGTAKPQEDDIVRSKTIAKVTGNVVLETFDDGSYLVACVLMAG